MNAQLSKLLAEQKPSRLGVHGTGNAYDSPEMYERMFPAWRECGVRWLKLVVAGDSGVETVRRLKAKCPEIIPIIRPYDTSCPANIIDERYVRWYVDAAGGPVVMESPFNEFYYDFENSWGRSLRGVSAFGDEFIGGAQPGEIKHIDLSKLTWAKAFGVRSTEILLSGMPADWPAQVANGWAQFAQIVLRAGGIPTTPAIEGWRYESHFVPLFTVLCRDYADLLKQSIVSMHNRPLNHPISYSADNGAWLAWQSMDSFVHGALGEYLPMIATEAGPEPGWNQDSNYPQITPESHAQMVKDMLTYPTPANYLADCFWLWSGSGAWAGATWTQNQTHMGGKDLPVVQMLKDWWPPEPPPVVPPVIPPVPPSIVDLARRAVDEDMETFPWGDKYARRHGMIPFADEIPFLVEAVWWYALPAFRLSDGKAFLVVFQAGHYTDAETIVVDYDLR
jgi:hypothetical protein